MSKKEVFVLFNFEAPDEQAQGVGKYRVAYFFDEEGEVSLQKFCEDRSGIGSDSSFLEFSRKELLVDFVKEYIASEGMDQGYILSAKDYNIGIESSSNGKELKEVFKRYGSIIELEPGQSKRSFLDKLF